MVSVPSTVAVKLVGPFGSCMVISIVLVLDVLPGMF